MEKKLNEVFKRYANENIFSSVNRLDKAHSTESVHNFSARKSLLLENEGYILPKTEFKNIIGRKQLFSEEIGTHPDFKYLEDEQDGHEFHYITSVFLDIKGSTKLATTLDLNQVKHIKNGTINTAIEIFQAFNGHVHRLQGDAVFAYFGAKSMNKSEAIVNAINACTYLQVLFTETVQPGFRDLGLPEIKIRIGMDFGDDEKVMWSRYGIKNTTEVTTTSLHTDLAAKLQNKAPAMGIMIGDNIKEYLDLPTELLATKEIIKNGRKQQDKFVLNTKEMQYKMWIFDWKKYIDKIFLIKPNNKYMYSAPNNFKFTCNYTYKCLTKYILTSCAVVPKTSDLDFELDFISPINYTDIQWTIINSGKEAEASEKELKIKISTSDGSTRCHGITAEYTGLHFMNCKIYSDKTIIADNYFGIYVHDDMNK